VFEKACSDTLTRGWYPDLPAPPVCIRGQIKQDLAVALDKGIPQNSGLL
jgi:hypothetical protein